MIKRKETKQIKIGDVLVGGNAPISVQSMCTTKTTDVQSTVSQIKELQDARCDIVRLAVPNLDAAKALKSIKNSVDIPIVADIHFDYRLALEAINSGIDALRLNPGNIGNIEHIKKVVEMAKKLSIPIRIGVNGGSLDKKLQDLPISKPEKMVLSAINHIKIFEELDFDLIKVSLKSSDVLTTIKAYELISEKINYPLHLGITEAGTLKAGLVKSALGIGNLLLNGIGDTIRVSLTENPVEEVFAGNEILKNLGLKKAGVKFISCPTCGRCQINLIELAKKVECKYSNLNKNITIAVMGCAVNGPGEAKEADIGIAGGIDEVLLFKKGEIVKKVPQNIALDEFDLLVSEILSSMQ